ncbi:unnamed protein product [Allacma fusca]|uniref:RING-type E3 ubiquitin transferase n=1 Tax=Allacma fusca TaxID=39272 RepID=A0A8J2KY29_9HEXA|nr:unnamed protein product [Allacma fusca]
MPPKQDPGGGDGGSNANQNPKNRGQKFKKPYQQHQSRDTEPRNGNNSRSKSNTSVRSDNSAADQGQKFYNQFNNLNVGHRPTPSGDSAMGNPRQQQRLPKDGISSEQVQEVLECPVCFEIPRPPIYNCYTGHIICGGCKGKIRECPLCRQEYSDSRNYVAEKLAESCTFKCPFAEQGCDAMIKLAQEARHSNDCNYRPLGCEVFPCKTSEVAYKDYISHMKTKHHSQFAPVNHWKATREVFVKKVDRLMQQGYRPPYVLTCHGNTFLQYTQAVGGKMWFWVSLLGTPEEAARYKITMALSSKVRDLRNTWVGPAHSVRHSGDDIYFNGLCMVTTEECLKAFFHTHAEGFPCYNLEILIEKI